MNHWYGFGGFFNVHGVSCGLLQRVAVAALRDLYEVCAAEGDDAAAAEAIALASEKVQYYVLRAKIYMFNEDEYDDDMAIEDLNKAIKLGSEEAKELLEEYFSEGDA